MTVEQRHARLVIAILLAFALDKAFGDLLSIHQARPNLVLCTLLIGCLYVGSNSGAALGFVAGLLEGSFAAVYLGSYLVSRALAGFVVGILEERLYRDSPFIALITVALGTPLTEGCFFLFAPQPHLTHWAIGVGFETLYNTLLALPLYFLIRRFARKKS